MTRDCKTVPGLRGPLAGLVLLLLSSCAASSTAVESDSDSSPVPVDTDTDFLAVPDRDSHVRLEGPLAQLQPGTLVELVPRGPWPGGESSRPAQALLMVTSVDGDGARAIVLGRRDRWLDLDTVYGRVTTSTQLPLSKSVTRVLSRDERTIRLAANLPDGVSAGDYFFVLGEPRGNPHRLGTRISALVQVTDVMASGSQAVVRHELTPIAAGDLAVFAHHAAPDAERPEALILFTRTRPEEAAGGFHLPPLATAMIEYQTEFQFSNIRVDALDVFIDPSAYDAAEQAQELAPEEGFGVIVFGQDRDDSFLYNITTYGASPSLATTVGILPGGLPLAMPDGLTALSSELAPSFLATAMTQRGDHAEVIYFLERCLQEERITGDVAFHAREHLALRYESIGRPLEALRLMDTDISTAQDAGNPYPELNALSIRQYLNRQQRSYELELDDLDAFLEVAEEVLPDESLLSERLERSRVLARLDRYDEAVDNIDGVIHQARRQDSLRWEVSAVLARANLLFRSGHIDEAISAVNESMSDARVLGDSFPRYSHALLAQYFAEQSNDAEAMTNMQAALAYASSDDSPYTLASTYELAGELHFAFDRVAEAVANMRQAAELYGRVYQFEDRARALYQSGMLELQATVAMADPGYLEPAYDHMAQAAETYMMIGDGRSAAQAYGGMAMVNWLLRNTAQGLANFGRTIDLGLAYNDPGTVAVAYQRTAEIYAAQGDLEHAQLALQTARVWAETFEMTELISDLEAMEQRLRSAI